jgi:hypothetical protein
MNFILDATTKSLVAVMSGAAATTNPDFTAAYADSTGALFTEGANDGAFNGTSQVTLVSAPAASTRRVIKSLTIKNRDTAAVTITISYNNNNTLRSIARVTLAVGDTWTTDGTFDTSGNLKQSMGTVNLASQVTGTLPVGNGGTGATTLTGVLKGNGTSAFTAATAGTDYVAPGTATTFTADQTFNSTRLKLAGSSSGTATLNAPAAAGTNTYTLPPDAATLGYRNIPQSGSDKTTSYTLATTDVGEFVGVGTSGSITIPNSTFAAGDVVSIFNNTTGNITITCSITTAYIAGTNTDKDTMTLATRGVATILFISDTVCVVSGNVT